MSVIALLCDEQASNPGQFDSESDAPWNKGPAQDTVYHVVRDATLRSYNLFAAYEYSEDLRVFLKL